jgi:hypothetical protein
VGEKESIQSTALDELLQICLAMRSSSPELDEFDGLKICENCQDAYTRGRLCRLCAEQEAIDNA